MQSQAQAFAPPPLQQQTNAQRKTYYAHSLQQGMDTIRKEMGHQAVIISTRMVAHPQNPHHPMVELVADAPAAPRSVMPADHAEQKIGGLDGPLAKIREVVVMPLQYPEMFQRLGVEPPRGVLMYGPPGCGKTLIARTLAKECGAQFFTVNGPELMAANLGESEKNLRDLFEKASEQQGIIFFDEMDAIAGRREESQSGAEKRLVTQLLTLMDGVSSGSRVVVLAATNLPDDIDPALRRSGRFDREIEIPIPDEKGRLEILKVHTRRMSFAPDVRLEDLAKATHGYVGADLANLCREAGMAALRESFPPGSFPAPGEEPVLIVEARHFKMVMKQTPPASMRGHMSERPTVRWDDIGGLRDVKQELMESVVLPLKKPELIRKMGIRPSKGVLLAGPPGTGKTLIARAAASECGVNFIAISGPSLVSKYVGETEKGIRDLFARARQAAPCILFFDEFDSIAPARESAGESGHSHRLVAQLLVELDGFDATKDVFCLAATNRPDAIDPAILRPGRIDKVIEVPLPDALSRGKIFELHLSRKPVEPNVNMDELVAASEGVSGADIEEICRRAAMGAVRKVLSGTGHLEPSISQRDLMNELAEICKRSGKCSSAKKTPRALVLDDDARVLNYTSQALRSAGFEDVAFEDPQQALASIQREHFDLAFLDINMPIMNGLEVLARIRALQPNMPVVMNTGRHDAATAVQSFRLGAVDYLEKPCTVQDILQAAEKAMNIEKTESS